MRYFLASAIIFLIFIFPAAQPSIPSAERETEPLWSGIQWRLVGPFRGGRSAAVCGSLTDPYLYYMGTAGGGVWKTENGGQSWECISDGYFGGSIGAVAVAPSDPNVIYVGEGEQTVRGDVSSGWGMWKSTCAGNTWQHIGLRGTEHISRIRIHPENPDIVYVASLGNLWKPNPERGIYKSTNGGITWEKILFESEEAGAIDLILDPNNPRIIYASTWQIKRNGYRMDSGGLGSHLWKSIDAGVNWVKLDDKEGLPDGVWGIVGIAVSPVNSERLWAIIENKEGGIFRSDDGGEHWMKVNEDRALRQRAWYYSRIYADTQNEDMLYVVNVSYHRSKDGGKTFQSFNAPHGDHHDLWIAPDDNQRMAIADDGGVQISFDGGEEWSTYYNQPTAQFYRVTSDHHFPFRILGAQQDNTTVRILHRSIGNGISEADWQPSAGGESAYLAPDPTNPDIVYGGTYKGYMTQYDHATGQTRSTNVWPFNPAGSGVEVMKYRFNWNYPLFFSPHQADKLYAASNHVHVTYDGGLSWDVISPDLTRNNPETLLSSGGPVTQDNTGVEYYGTIFAITESHIEKGVIWTGSDDGLMHISRDGGENWTDVTPPVNICPTNNMINCIDVHPQKKGTAYVAATAYKFGDYQPYLYKTQDYGKTWKKITKGIHPHHYTRVIRADHSQEGLLYAGTEWGMYISFDDGENWQSMQLNLPVVSIRDLHIRDNMLIAATHGRSFWMIDDLSPFQQWNEKIAGEDYYLFSSKPTYRLAQGGRGSFNALLEGENHPDGVLLHFFIKELDSTDSVRLEFYETNGNLIKSFSNKAKKKAEKLEIEAGGNRFIWNTRYEGFKTFPGMVLYSAPNRGPKAVPGEYIAKLIVNEGESLQTFEIKPDPRLELSRQDYQDQFDFVKSVRDKVSQAHQSILDIRKIKDDIDFIKGRINQDQHQEIIDRLILVRDSLTSIENMIHETRNKSVQDPLNYGIKVNNRLAFLMQDTQRGDGPPTAQAQAVFSELGEELDSYLRLYEAQKKEILATDQMIREAGISFFNVSSGKP